MISAGFQIAVSAQVGNKIGQQDPKLAKLTQNWSQLLSLCLFTSIGLTINFYIRELSSFFSSDPQVIETIASVRHIYSVSYVLNSLKVTQAGVVRALGIQAKVVLIFLIGNWVINLGLVRVLYKNMGFGSIWMAKVVADMCIFSMT